MARRLAQVCSNYFPTRNRRKRQPDAVGDILLLFSLMPLLSPFFYRSHFLTRFAFLYKFTFSSFPSLDRKKLAPKIFQKLRTCHLREAYKRNYNKNNK